MNEIIEYKQTENFIADISSIIEESQQIAIQSVNVMLVLRNWLLGKRIATENMDGSRSERYGESIITNLANNLTTQYGKGFDKRSLYRYVQFYKQYPEIVRSVPPQSVSPTDSKIEEVVSPQFSYGKYVQVNRKRILSWSHYERLLQVPDLKARTWYENEAIEQSWSVRTLRRNINTQYYERMLLSTDKKVLK